MGGLAKGLAVIRAFGRDHAALTLSDIARSARIPAATARRCLLTLEELGYVTRSGRDFLLRPRVLELGAAYLESMNIEQITKTYLEELASRTADSAALSVLDGAEKEMTKLKDEFVSAEHYLLALTNANVPAATSIVGDCGLFVCSVTVTFFALVRKAC